MTTISLSQYAVFITANLPYILLGLTVLILMALIVFININIKMSRLNRRYQKMMTGMENVNIEQLLIRHGEQVGQMSDRVKQLDTQWRRLDLIATNSIHHIGLVRFNAFEGTGGDLSFALVMLDANRNGVVLSSIYGRDESRVYAKPMVSGQSAYHLTDEEKQALSKAMEIN